MSGCGEDCVCVEKNCENCPEDCSGDCLCRPSEVNNGD